MYDLIVIYSRPNIMLFVWLSQLVTAPNVAHRACVHLFMTAHEVWGSAPGSESETDSQNFRLPSFPDVFQVSNTNKNKTFPQQQASVNKLANIGAECKVYTARWSTLHAWILAPALISVPHVVGAQFVLKPIHGKIIWHYSLYCAVAFCYEHKCELFIHTSWAWY